MNNFSPQHLNRDDLDKMMLEHNNYCSSGGKEGKMADLTGYIIEDFDFSGQDLSSIDVRMSKLIRCKFVGCDLAYTYLSGSEFIDVDFSDAVFVKAELYDVKAERTCFDRANLRRAEFMSAKLVDVSFRDTDLGGGILSDSELIRTIFDGSNFGGAAVGDNQETDTSWVNVNGKRDTSQIAS